MHKIFTVLFIVSTTLTSSSAYTLKERTPFLNTNAFEQTNLLSRLISPPRKQFRQDFQNRSTQKRSPWGNNLPARTIQSNERTQNENQFPESLFRGEKQEVDSFIQAVMRCKHIPGLAVAVVREGERWTEGYGVEEVETGVPVGSGTLFGLGSVTKAFTSALLAIALEKVCSMGSNINWQTKVKELMSEDLELCNHLQDNVTLEDILSHRTGIMAADIMAVAGFPQDMTRAQFLRKLRYLTDILSLRSAWHYNNWIYSLAEDVTEYLLGGKWEKLLKEQLLLPLGMKDALLVWNDVNVTSSKMARPYQRIRGTLKEVDSSLFDLRQGKPAGALAVSADDMTKWMTFLLSGGVLPSGDRLLSQRMMKDMMTSHISLNASFSDVPVGDHLVGYGFGWFPGSYRGKPTVSHTGGWFGYQSTLTLFPEDKTAVFVAVSGPGTSAGTDAFRAISYFLSDLALGYPPWLNQSTACSFGVKPGDEINGDNTEEKKSDSNTIQNPQRYLGKYSNPLFGDVVIKKTDSHHGLTMQFQRLEGFLIPGDKDLEFHVQYNGKTEFYSVENFKVTTSRLSFGRPSGNSDGKCVSLVLRAPAPEDLERLEFTRTD